MFRLDVDAQSGTLANRLFIAIREALLNREVMPGAALPSTRDLARTLGISRNTVVEAYRRLMEQGLIESRHGRGTFAARHIVEMLEASVEGAAAFVTPGIDQPIAESWLGDRIAGFWRAAVARSDRDRHPAGILRSLAGEVLRTRGVECSPDQVIVVRNERAAVDLAMRLLLRPGDDVWMEEPGNPAARAAIELTGARAVPVAVDPFGLNVNAGMRAAPHPRAIYVTARYQYPHGVPLNEERAAKLGQFAAAENAWIIDDNSPGVLRAHTLPTLFRDVPANVIRICSVAPILNPICTIAMLVVPSQLRARFARAAAITGSGPSAEDQAALSELIDSGRYARLARAMRRLARIRRDAIDDACSRELSWCVARVTGHETGTCAILWLHAQHQVDRIRWEARRCGVDAGSLQDLAFTPGHDALLIHLGGVRTEDLAQVFRTLSRMIRAHEATAMPPPLRRDAGDRAAPSSSHVLDRRA